MDYLLLAHLIEVPLLYRKYRNQYATIVFIVLCGLKLSKAQTWPKIDWTLKIQL